jgi:3-deoxy-7-phosphoheptulonate synthase
MIVVMKPSATEEQIEEVAKHIHELDLEVHYVTGTGQSILAVIGDTASHKPRELAVINDGVQSAMRVAVPYKLASRDVRPEGSILNINGVNIGSSEISLMAGPCSVEGPEMIDEIASYVAKSGAKILRGGAFKPRTSPYSFQGLGELGLQQMREAADKHNLLVITEVMDTSQVDLVAQYADILQVGARNMQNYDLLRATGQQSKPVLLKRGLSATVEEFLLAAEYILVHGNHNVILCERGIRTFAKHTRFTLDLGAIPVLREMTHLPIIIDPSHCMGVRDKVTPMALAAIAAGADGLIVETHPDPDHALSDGPQALLPDQFVELTEQIAKVAHAVGRSFNPGEREAVSV